MSEIIETYQEEQERLAAPELPGMAFATVVSVNEDGLELRFDGEEEASTKRYPCNVGVSFSAGQRALLMKVNGSYVALCPVGLQGGGGEHYEVFAVGQDGLVPGPAAGETEKYLRGDGTWAAPGGGGPTITVNSRSQSVSIGTLNKQAVAVGTFTDSAPSDCYHMGVAGVYTNSNYVVANAAPTSISDAKGGSATIRYQAANPTASSRSGVTLYVIMRYLKIT